MVSKYKEYYEYIKIMIKIQKVWLKYEYYNLSTRGTKNTIRVYKM